MGRGSGQGPGRLQELAGAGRLCHIWSPAGLQDSTAGRLPIALRLRAERLGQCGAWGAGEVSDPPLPPPPAHEPHPPLRVLRRFIHLLNQSQQDFLAEAELLRLQEQVVRRIRANQQLERDLALMDTKIGLLVKSRATLQVRPPAPLTPSCSSCRLRLAQALTAAVLSPCNCRAHTALQKGSADWGCGLLASPRSLSSPWETGRNERAPLTGPNADTDSKAP